MSTFLEAFHFLRPQALWLLLLVPAAVLWAWLRQRRRTIWRENVDPHLLPHLLTGMPARSLFASGAITLGIVLGTVALAGPSWRQQAQPLWQSQAPLVAVLDLSDRITATDLQPSRLLQARAKLATLLRERHGGEIALVVYAGEAFTVAPLTADAANVALFLDALSPEVMPVAGQQADKALQWATGLLQQARARQGDILLITNGADDSATRAATRAATSGYRVSTLGLGTAAGAAYRDRSGGIQRAALDERSLRAVATAGNGRYARLTADDEDLHSLDVLQPSARQSAEGGNQAGRVWRDEGYWLLPPLMLLALLAFRRRGGVLTVLAMVCLLPMAPPAHAAESGWWQRADQQQHRQLSAGVDAYRQGDFAGAQQHFEGIDTDQGWYNLGNALARQGKYDEAIAAYDRALNHQPKMPDAVANRAAVEAARKRQQQDQKDGKQGGEGDSSSSPGDAKPSPGSSSPDKNGEQKPADGKPQGRPSESSSSKPQSAPDEAEHTPKVEDAQSQQQADQAQRERMQQAMQQAAAGTQGDAPQPAQTAQQREQRQAVEAWMQRVPDEPGNLLKTKFQLEYERRTREGR